MKRLSLSLVYWAQLCSWKQCGARIQERLWETVLRRPVAVAFPGLQELQAYLNADNDIEEAEEITDAAIIASILYEESSNDEEPAEVHKDTDEPAVTTEEVLAVL